MAMLNIPILRWGQPYTSLETEDVVHFITGETLARVSQANTGLLGRDMRLAERARQVLTEISVSELTVFRGGGDCSRFSSAAISSFARLSRPRKLSSAG